jgi:hypothetical protein
MRITLNHIALLLAAGAAAVAITVAPTAVADPNTFLADCSTGSPGTQCVTPGNAQINDSLAPDFEPQYPDFSFFGLGRHGGGHR